MVSPVTGVAGFVGDAGVVEALVRDGAPIAGKTLRAATEEGLLSSELLVVRINRDEDSVTLTSATRIREGDFVTIHS